MLPETYQRATSGYVILREGHMHSKKQNMGTTLLNLELNILCLNLVFHCHVKLNHVHNLEPHAHEIKEIFCPLRGSVFILLTKLLFIKWSILCFMVDSLLIM